MRLGERRNLERTISNNGGWTPVAARVVGWSTIGRTEMGSEMIEEIRGRFKMEIRPNSQGCEYLEAVIGRDDLELLKSVLMKHLGQAAKEPEREANLPVEIQGLVDSMGGLRVDQYFYYNQGKQWRNCVRFPLAMGIQSSKDNPEGR